MSRIARVAAVILCGILSCCLTALLVYLLDWKLHMAVYLFSAEFIPIGGIAVGFVAAAGYRVGASLLQYPPTRTLRVWMTATSTLTYCLIIYLKYTHPETPDLPALQSNPHYSYLELLLRTQNGGLVSGIKTEAVGLADYLYVAFRLLGFGLGGWYLFDTLSSRVYCEPCKRYRQLRSTVTRYCPTVEAGATVFRQSQTLLSRGHGFLAEQLVSSLTEVESNASCKIVLSMWVCPDCRQEGYVFLLQEFREQAWRTVQKYCARGAVPAVYAAAAAGAAPLNSQTGGNQ